MDAAGSGAAALGWPSGGPLKLPLGSAADARGGASAGLTEHARLSRVMPSEMGLFGVDRTRSPVQWFTVHGSYLQYPGIWSLRKNTRLVQFDYMAVQRHPVCDQIIWRLYWSLSFFLGG